MKTRSGFADILLAPLFALAALALATASCSIDYSEIAFGDKLEDKVPDYVVYEYEHNVVRDGQLVFRLVAAKAAIYGEARKTLLEGVRFEEFAPGEAAPKTSGRALRARLDNATNDVEIEGDIVFDSRRDDLKVETDYLYWKDSEKRLLGRDDIVTTVTRSSGTVLRGAGFSADARERSVQFTEKVEGTIVTDGDGEGGQP